MTDLFRPPHTFPKRTPARKSKGKPAPAQVKGSSPPTVQRQTRPVKTIREVAEPLNQTGGGLDRRELLAALTALGKGDFSARLPAGLDGLDGRIAEAFNEVIELSESLAVEFQRVSRVVGKEGCISERASVGHVSGAWATEVASINALIVDLVHPASKTARVIGALAKGDLSKKIAEQAAWLQQRAAQLQKLASASIAINGAQSMSRTLQLITESARDVIGAHQGITLFLLDGQDAQTPPKTRAFCSFSDKYAGWRGRPMNLDSVADSVVARSSAPSRVSVSDLPAHPDFALVKRLENNEIPPVIGLLAAPLIGRQGRTMGVIYVSDKTAGEFTADDEAILVQLAQMASVAVENILNAEAREANRAKDQFIAVLSHELRTPLTPVLVTLTNLQADNRMPAELREDLQLVRRNVELEARLIDDLLDLTRISKGKVELQLEVVDANELVREAAGICRNDIVEKGIELVLDLSARQRQVKGDATRLQQVFWNVIKNAVKFSSPKGRIVIESSNPNDGVFCVRVSDSGIGIEPEVLPRIFRAFDQGRSSVTRKFGGLGLGLAISKALIEQHGGSLEAYSPGRNKGAVFTVRMPTTREEPRPRIYPAPRLASTAVPRTVRILQVEDHRDTARVMAKLLRSNGYVVECAASFTEALALLKTGLYEVLVSDIGLPDGSGLDLIRQARALQPITGIALSGFGMEHDIRRSLDAGFALHLTKPINLQLLIDSIDRLTAAADEPVAGTIAR